MAGAIWKAVYNVDDEAENQTWDLQFHKEVVIVNF